MSSSMSVMAQQLSADDIMNEAYRNFKYQGDDRSVMANMALKNKNGKVIMERELLVLRKNEEGSLSQKWYTHFLKPADLRKMVFLSIKNPEEDDDRWLFLPSLDLVKRLAGSDKRSSFAGSQFVYEDITGRIPNLDNHSLSESSGESYVVTSTPKNSKSLEFAYYKTYVDKESMLPSQQVFYSSNDKVLKTFKIEKTEVIQGFNTVTSFSMTDNETGESTYTTYSNIKYNVGVEDKIFTESYIKRSPRKWLK